MKIRTDFVSNSSSSSFVLWGVSIPQEEFIKAFKNDITEEQYNKVIGKYDEPYEAIIKGINSLNTDSDDDTYDEDSEFRVDTIVYEFLSNLFDTSLFDSYDENIYIGESPSSQQDTETLGEFKQKIIDKIHTFFPSLEVKPVKLYTGVNCDGELSFD